MIRLPLLLALVAAAPLGAQDVVGVAPEVPVRGEPVRITFSAPADTATVTYRPGAITAVTETFTPGASTFEFTPERAGVVSVSGGGAGQNLSVRFQRAPASGLLVMLVAGLILFGGAGVSLRALLADGHRIEPDDTTFRPDT